MVECDAVLFCCCHCSARKDWHPGIVEGCLLGVAQANRQIRRLLFYIGLSARSKQRRRMRGRRAKMTLSVLVNLDKSFYILGGAIS